MSDPTRLDFALHHAKVQAHRVRRWLVDRANPIARVVPSAPGELAAAPVLAEDRSPLWNPDVDPREWPLEAGKVENLRVAVRSLDGIELTAGQIFSFWAQIGPPLRVRGFVPGRELREGCVVPGIGGGLCLLSNALFSVAKRAAFELIERHAHSKRPPGSRAELGEDATVAWNYIDLRFRATKPWRLEVELSADELSVRVRADRAGGRRFEVLRSPPAREALDHGPSCLSCGHPCHRAEARPRAARARRTWLLDAHWPEHGAWLREHVQASDRIALPIDGSLLGRERYAWPRVRVAARMQFPVQLLLRSLHSRRLAEQGAERQQALLHEAERMAKAMVARLDPDDVELVVAQELLPFVWRLGAHGGRRVSVLMTRLPLLELQATLDEAAARHPHSPTLADFRADPSLVRDEARALAHAESIITPHSQIAACFPGKAIPVSWSLPSTGRRSMRRRSSERPRLWLPASTVGRKGAYELREALRGLNRPIHLHVSGRELEGPHFWDALPISVEHGPIASLEAIDLAVLPAWVEHAPRALLRAVAHGLPTVASRACGLAGVAGVREVATGDVEALRVAITESLDWPESGVRAASPV